MISLNQLYLFLTITTVLLSLNLIGLLLLVRLVKKALSQKDQDHSAYLQNELNQMITDHFNDYIKNLLPEDGKTRQQLTKKYQSALDKTLKRIETETESIIHFQTQSLQQVVAEKIEVLTATLETQTQQDKDHYRQALAKQLEQRLQVFDKQVQDLVNQTAASVLQRELTVEDHTKIIKEQLNQAREYYE